MIETDTATPPSLRSAKAASLLAEIAERWRTTFQDQIASLDQLCARGDAEGLYRIMHDAKGLAPTLGYDLVAEIAARVTARLQGRVAALDANDRRFVLAAQAACAFILARNVRGDGADVGRAILSGLDGLGRELQALSTLGASGRAAHGVDP